MTNTQPVPSAVGSAFQQGRFGKFICSLSLPEGNNFYYWNAKFVWRDRTYSRVSADTEAGDLLISNKVLFYEDKAGFFQPLKTYNYE